MGRKSLGEAVSSVVGQLTNEDQLIIEMDWPLTMDYGNRARDVGAAKARTTHIWFLDDDDVALPGALDSMREAIEEDPLTGWVFQVQAGGAILPREQRIQYSAGCQCYLVPAPAPQWVGRSDLSWANGINSQIGLKWRKAVVASLGVGKVQA
jgi:glycosyl transferase family 2